MIARLESKISLDGDKSRKCMDVCDGNKETTCGPKN